MTQYSLSSNKTVLPNKIQKGFPNGVSGVQEHTSMMGHIINKARLKQRSVVITLLDLKNAFGEVHHNLIKSVLSYHHIPLTVQLLVANLYTGFHLSIISDCFTTPPIPFQRGVLHGGSLSPFCLTCALTHLYNSLSKENMLN